ncbi:MAG: hypothetical protein ACK4J0_02840 [Candidatus Anstonellaceae archaeon]
MDTGIALVLATLSTVLKFSLINVGSKSKKVYLVGSEDKPGPSKKKDILKLYWTTTLPLRKIARICGVSHTTVWRVVNSK